MGQVSITLVRADTNQEFDVELPDDAAITELLPALVKELGLPLTGQDGNQVAYELSNKRTGTELKESETLGSAGVKNGDLMLLTSTFVAGDELHHGHQLHLQGRSGQGLRRGASLLRVDPDGLEQRERLFVPRDHLRGRQARRRPAPPGGGGDQG